MWTMTGARHRLRTAGFMLLMISLASTGWAQPRSSGRAALLILDASGSMNERMPDGRTRFQAAKAAVGEMTGKLPAGMRVGLRAYGHQSNPSERNCEDTELVSGFVEVEQGRAPLLERVGRLQARGYTPITLSLQRGADDIAKEQSADRIIVLLSDGRETCRGDPCAAARALASADAKLVIHVIGLGVDAAARTQLQCIASVARGTYFDANTSQELSERLGRAAVIAKAEQPVPRPAVAALGVLTIRGIMEAGAPVLDATGEVVGAVGAVQPRLELRPGIYSVQFANGSWTGVQIKAGETTEIEPAYLKIETPAKDNLYLLDTETGEELGAFFMEASPVVAVLPGRYSAHTSLPFAWTGIELLPGRTTVVRPALARISHRTGDAEQVLYRIVQIASGIEGTAVNASDLSLPPGRYRAEDPDHPEQAVEFEVNEGELKDVVIDR